MGGAYVSSDHNKTQFARHGLTGLYDGAKEAEAKTGVGGNNGRSPMRLLQILFYSKKILE
jgi:hypothetical protein